MNRIDYPDGTVATVATSWWRYDKQITTGEIAYCRGDRDMLEAGYNRGGGDEVAFSGSFTQLADALDRRAVGLSICRALANVRDELAPCAEPEEELADTIARHKEEEGK